MVNPVLLMLLKSRVMDLALSLLPVITYSTSAVNKFLESGQSSQVLRKWPKFTKDYLINPFVTLGIHLMDHDPFTQTCLKSIL